MEEIPKKIKKIRKVKYPKKRDNYRRYSNADWEWEDVLKDVETQKDGGDNHYMKTISERYNIKYSTLQRKYSKWKNNKCLQNDERRGGHNKTFTEDEERILFNYIKTVFIDCNLIFNDNHLRYLAIQYYNMSRKERDANFIIDEKFSISNGWIAEFKKRWKLSSLKTKINRKGVKIDPKEYDNFIKECSNINDTYEKHLIYNLDETFWRINSAHGQVIGLTNSDHRKVETIVDESWFYCCVCNISKR